MGLQWGVWSPGKGWIEDILGVLWASSFSSCLSRRFQRGHGMPFKKGPGDENRVSWVFCWEWCKCSSWQPVSKPHLFTTDIFPTFKWRKPYRSPWINLKQEPGSWLCKQGNFRTEFRRQVRAFCELCETISTVGARESEILGQLCTVSLVSYFIRLCTTLAILSFECFWSELDWAQMARRKVQC